ncbi:COX15/CtaA family protein [Rhizobacter sp. AJA081-3]|uniref:COX15/CtaA family protein n=1 Tax=Rhizobacter sp. AJA081-3 TaxID=2753607 RepID=UPI001ADEC009|nr:COX15/CtaA family protein [Rhizobacter sp. AJA081-3]QTN24213.1 COX15/CtaA family protein [Rhizobacter sp. AJA081-3]
MDAQPLYDLTPIVRMAALGVVLALGPLAWVWLRHRGATPAVRMRALTLLTLFLTFDLVVFGAFTRLSDSGLGCPDWPGCYGNASPLGAKAEIHAEQSLRPSGPVTHGKAWVEMVHRYLATAVGVLITVMALASWYEARRGRSTISPWWATATLVWVCAQGAFGALTVTLKLYPAIVTLHLLGGIGLLALLAVQGELALPRPMVLDHGTRRLLLAVAALTLLQVSLGGWVSTNYAVLACSDFPTCQGAWWPEMDFRHGFTLRRELGETRGGDFLPFAALTAIHYTHRLMAYAVFVALLWLAWRLHRSAQAAPRRAAFALIGVALWQLASGLGNVVLGWPLAAALAHTAGAAVLVALLAVLLVRTAPASLPETGDSRQPARPARAML